MAIARPAAAGVATRPLAAPRLPLPEAPSYPGALPAPPSLPAPDTLPAGQAATQAVALGHIRRCSFRRVLPQANAKRQLMMYDVDCLHPSYEAPLSLGTIDAAREACAGCVLPGVFRPDED